MAETTLRNDIELLRKILMHQKGINETIEILKLNSANDIASNNLN